MKSITLSSEIAIIHLQILSLLRIKDGNDVFGWSLYALKTDLKRRENLIVETKTIQSFLDELIVLDLVSMSNFLYKINHKKSFIIKIEISE